MKELICRTKAHTVWKGTAGTLPAELWWEPACALLPHTDRDEGSGAGVHRPTPDSVWVASWPPSSPRECTRAAADLRHAASRHWPLESAPWPPLPCGHKPSCCRGRASLLSSLHVVIFNGNTLTQLCFMYPVAGKTKTVPLRYPAIKEVEHPGKLLQILSAISSISASLFISSQITNYRMWKSPYR